MTAVVELILRVDPDDEMVATVELDEERLSVLMKISVSSGPPIAFVGQKEWLKKQQDESAPVRTTYWSFGSIRWHLAVLYRTTKSC